MSHGVPPNTVYGGGVSWNFPVCEGAALWTPVQLGAQVVGWFDASNLPSLTIAGGLVSQWASLVGGITANAAAAARPTYSATGRNGKPALLFNGATTQMLISSTAGFPLGANAGFIAGQAFASGFFAYQAILGYGSVAASQLRTVVNDVVNSASANDLVGSISLPATWPGDATPIAEFTAAKLGLRVNGGAETNLALGGLNTPLLAGYIGAYSAGAGLWNGAIQELLVISGALTVNNANKLSGYLMWKWGVQALINPANPYFTAPPTI